MLAFQGKINQLLNCTKIDLNCTKIDKQKMVCSVFLFNIGLCQPMKNSVRMRMELQILS